MVNVPPFCTIMFELHVFEEYKESYPDLNGRELTDQYIRLALAESGIKDAVIQRTDKGKPFLRGGNACLSVSHSADMIVICIADEEVGIDLQYARGINAKKIANRFFSVEENDYIRSCGRPEDAFFRLWTRKEAFAKLTGEGMGQLVKPIPVLARSDVEFEDFTLEEGLYCSICTYK